MSIINKMLSDLEERHNHYREHNQVMLGDLAPVNETGFNTPKKLPYNFLLVCFFLTALSVTLYGYFGENFPGSGNTGGDNVADNPAIMVSAGRGTNKAENSAAIIPLLQTTEASNLSGLKLDLSLPLQARVDTSSVDNNAGIKAITVNTEADITTIELLLDQSARYRVYTLENPDRALLEIENVLLEADIPVVAEHPYLERLRYSNISGESFKLVADSSWPLSIESSDMQGDSENGYKLSLRLQADANHIRNTQTSASSTSIEESSSGEMSVKPSAGPGKTVERLFAEARQLYARRDFRNADEAIQTILKQQPLHIQARTLYATTLINRGDTGLAVQILDNGLALNPGISEWADIYARQLVNMGRNDAAVEVLSRAMPDISHHDYYAFYAALLQRLSRHEEASEFYRTLLKQNPDNGLWWMGLGISLDAMAYRDGALQAFESALQGQNLDYDLRQYVLQQIERLSG